MIADTYAHQFGNDDKEIISTSDALCVSLETRDRMELVILPYTLDLNGKISFGKETWESRKEKFSDSMACEGLVQ